jgi:hypothetical protein
LRLLQDGRSSGSAHLKGSRYKKVAERLGLTGRPPPEVFSGLLSNAIEMLDSLSAFFAASSAAPAGKI